MKRHTERPRDYNRVPRLAVTPGVWLRPDSPLKANDRLVLLIVSLHGQKDTRESFPSIEIISAESKRDKKVVRVCLQRLVKFGALEVIDYPGRPKTYRVNHLDWSQDIGVPWLTKHPSLNGVGVIEKSAKKRLTPPLKTGTPPLIQGDPSLNSPAVKGINSVNRIKQSKSRRKSAADAVSAQEGRTAPPETAESSMRGGDTYVCIGCEQKVTIVNSQHVGHAAGCRIAKMGESSAPALDMRSSEK